MAFIQIFVFASFLFGLIIGSFANVFVLRWGTGKVVGGRSSCASCGHKLSWYELIPVLSFVIQRGRCRACEGKISWQYVVVELMLGFLFATWAYISFALLPVSDPSLFFLYGGLVLRLLAGWVATFLLISIAVYDLRHFIIPDGMVYTYIAFSFLWGLMFHGVALQGLWITLTSGIIVALPLFILWAISRGRWMGFGDVKLTFGMGMMLGGLGGLSALVFGIWMGAIVSLSVIGLSRLFRLAPGSRHLTMKSEIPFGPFLVAGALFVFMSNITLLRLVEII